MSQCGNMSSLICFAPQVTGTLQACWKRVVTFSETKTLKFPPRRENVRTEYFTSSGTEEHLKSFFQLVQPYNPTCINISNQLSTVLSSMIHVLYMCSLRLVFSDAYHCCVGKKKCLTSWIVFLVPLYTTRTIICSLRVGKLRFQDVFPCLFCSESELCFLCKM